MLNTTIKFEQVDTSNPDEGRIVNQMEVPASADGETVSFTLPSGEVWHCDQGRLAKLVSR